MSEHDDLSGALHALADRDGTAPAPVEQILHRGRTARRRRTATRSGLALSVTAAVGAATAFTVTGPGRAPAAPHHPGTAVAAPGVRLAAAVQRTGGVSFRFTSYGNLATKDRDSGGACTGAWDPKRHTGFTRTPAGEIRIIGADTYDRSAPGTARPHGWKKVHLSLTKALSCSGSTVSPSGVLRRMRKEGPVRDLGKRTHAGRTYHVYQVRSTKPVLGDGSYDTTQAWVGERSGYVERVLSYQAPKGDTAIPSAVFYSGFGKPVKVDRP